MNTVLAELEACSFRNKSLAETATHMKPLLDKYLPLSSNSSASSTLKTERQKDHYSHFILRLAFASTEDLRRRFSRVETTLFRLRFLADDQRERKAFVDSINFGWESIDEQEKRDLGPDLVAAGGGFVKRLDEENWYKVDWDSVPELVQSRSVLVKAGKAYVPGRELQSMVVAEFTSRLDKSLEVQIFSFNSLRRSNTVYSLPPVLYLASMKMIG
jgi:DNA primase large subunit